MVMLPNQKARQKPVGILWSESFWVVPIIRRERRATLRRVSLAAATGLVRRVSIEAKTTNVPNVARYVAQESQVRKRRGRGDLRRELGCPVSSLGSLNDLTSLPLRCPTSPRLRLQYLF